jgi:hypothetical protein
VLGITGATGVELGGGGAQYGVEEVVVSHGVEDGMTGATGVLEEVVVVVSHGVELGMIGATGVELEVDVVQGVDVEEFVYPHDEDGTTGAIGATGVDDGTGIVVEVVHSVSQLPP